MGMAGRRTGQSQCPAGQRGPWVELVPPSWKLSGGCEDSGLRVAGWDWCPLVLLVASLYWEPPGWKLDFLSAQILEKVPCF